MYYAHGTVTGPNPHAIAMQGGYCTLPPVTNVTIPTPPRLQRLTAAILCLGLLALVVVSRTWTSPANTQTLKSYYDPMNILGDDQFSKVACDDSFDPPCRFRVADTSWSAFEQPCSRTLFATAFHDARLGSRCDVPCLRYSL